MSDMSEKPLTTSSVLYAAAKEIGWFSNFAIESYGFHGNLGRRCAKENRAFLECKDKEENPENCLQQVVVLFSFQVSTKDRKGRERDKLCVAVTERFEHNLSKGV